MAHRRACAACGGLQPLKDRRTRRLQTLFGTVEVEAPRFKLCHCRQPAPASGTALFSPACALLTARCRPELERVQAELGARTSLRKGAGILESLPPVSPTSHKSLRARTHAVALRIEADDQRAAAEVMVVPDKPARAVAMDVSRPVVMLDGAYVCAVPGTLEPPPLAPPDHAQIDVERLRPLLWSGYHEKACEALGRIASRAKNVSVLNDPAIKARAKRLVARCAELQIYIENNEGTLIGYGQRYRAGKPIVTPRHPSHASGQGRSAGRAVRPPGHPTRGVAPQILTLPSATSAARSRRWATRRCSSACCRMSPSVGR